MFFRFLGGGGGGIPPDRPRINTGELGRSGRKFPVHGVQDQGDEESENFCAFAHNIFKNAHRKCLFTYIDIVGNKTKKCSEKHKHYARAVVRRNRKFCTAADPFLGAQYGQNLISWRWSLCSPTDPVVQDSYVKNRVNPPLLATEMIPAPIVSEIMLEQHTKSHEESE